jgi:hypothetical protein
MSLKDPIKSILAKGKIKKTDFENIKEDLLSVTKAEKIVFEALKEDSKIDYEVVVDV